MKFTIVYDSEVARPELKADRGFSCLVEPADGPGILLDTGASGSVLRHNLEVLGIDARSIGTVVISHRHPDHTGGLEEMTRANEDVEVCVPESFMRGTAARRVSIVRGPREIRPGIFTTGELSGVEQSLVVATDGGPVVVVGCAHPGLGAILRAAGGFGAVWGVIGGFHGFSDFGLLDSLSLVCPCHCTVYRAEMKERFGKRCVGGRVGTVIEL